MYSNSRSWSGFPTQYAGYPSYYAGVPHTTNTTNIPHPVPYASHSGSPLATTHLTASAREFAPGGMAGPTSMTPSPGLPLPKKKAIRILNPTTGEAVVLRPPDLAAETAGVPKPTQPAERPLTKKERKRKAKLEAEEKQRQEEEEREAKRKAEEDERLKKLEEQQQKKREEEGKSGWEEKVERRRRGIEEEARIRREKLKEEQERKQREETEEEKRLRRLAEDEKFAAKVEELRKKKEVSRLFPFASPTASTSSAATPAPPPQIPGGFGFSPTQRPLITSSLFRNWAFVRRIDDLSRMTYPEGINPPAAELDHGQMPGGKYKHVYDREFLLQFMQICKEEPDYASNLDGLGVKRQERLFVRDNPSYEPSARAKGRRIGAMGVPSSSISTGVTVGRGLTGLPGKNPFLPLNGERGPTLKTSDERFRASTKQLEATAILQSASSSPHTQEVQGHPVNQDSSIGLASPKDEDVLQAGLYYDLAEDEENTKGAAVEVRNDHVTINAISELSKQMKQILREMKDLKDEVRELRSLTQREDKKERGKVRTRPGGSLEGGAPKAERLLESPYRESSAPQAKPRTATAVNPYFIMKEGELDFVQGDVITLLDPEQDTPSPSGSGWLYGEINVTKRGFFPASYVKLQKVTG